MYMIHTRYRIHIYEFVIDDIKKTFSGRLNDFLLINIFIRFSVKIPIKYFLSHDIQWFDRKSKSQKKKKKSFRWPLVKLNCPFWCWKWKFAYCNISLISSIWNIPNNIIIIVFHLFICYYFLLLSCIVFVHTCSHIHQIHAIWLQFS